MELNDKVGGSQQNFIQLAENCIARVLVKIHVQIIGQVHGNQLRLY